MRYVTSRNIAPPVSKLARELYISEEEAKKVRWAWKEAKISELLEEFPLTRRWVNQCWHKPGNREIRMNAIDEVLDGFFGVGTLGKNKHGQWVYTLNSGDMYNTTLGFVAGRMFVTSDAELLMSGYVKATDNDDFLER